MASPLSWFRRHQKGMLVVFGCLLMAAFGLAGVMSNLTPRGSRDTTRQTPVVQWQGGTFTNGDFSNLRYRHFRTMNFLRQLQQAMVQQRGANYQPRARAITPMYDGVSPDQMDRQVMQRILALEKAREIGIQVSNTAVMRYLRNLADDQNLSHRDMDAFCAQAFNNSVDFIEIRDQLKDELAIEQVNIMSNSGVPFRPSLTEAWQDFLKLETRLECELLGYPVSDFLAQVTDSPSVSELRGLYVEGKYEYPDLTGEKPGFKRPRQLAVTMLTADYNDFLERAKLAITPEQIQTEYDLLVTLNDPLVTEIVPVESQGDDNMSGDDPPPSLGDALTPEGETPDPDSPTDPSDDGGESEMDDRPADAGDNPDEDNSDEDNASDEDGDDGTEEPADDEDGGAELEMPVMLPSLPGVMSSLAGTAILNPPTSLALRRQDETPADPAPEQPQTDQSGDETSTGDESGDQEDEQTFNPDDLPAPGQPASDPAINPGGNLPGDQESGIQTRIRPLDQYVSDGIRARLAGKPAIDAMNLAINEASADIGDYGVDFDMWKQTRDLPPAEREPEPDPMDFEALAARHLLQYRHVDLTTELDFEETEMGKTMVAIEVPSMFGVQKQDVQISDMLFGQYYRLETYRPESYEEYFRPNQHVVFVEEKKDPEIPEFADAREDVENFWKRGRALELATAAATGVADQLNAAGQQLAEQHADQARNTGDFTWHTQTSLYPVLPGNIRPGEEFMEAAFSTAINQAAVAPDALRENVYVIQPVRGDQRTPEEIEKLFFESLSANKGVGPGLNQLHQNQLREMSADFYQKLEDEYEVKWLAH